MEKSKVKDPGLAAAGKLRVEWAESRMPVLMALKEKHGKEKSLKGMRVAGCLHVTKETAVLVKTIVAAGAEVSWSGCNPLSTQDDVAAALVAEYGIGTFADPFFCNKLPRHRHQDVIAFVGRLQALACELAFHRQ